MGDQGEKEMDEPSFTNFKLKESSVKSETLIHGELQHKEDLSNSFDDDQSDKTIDNDVAFDQDTGLSPDRGELTFDQDTGLSPDRRELTFDQDTGLSPDRGELTFDQETGPSPDRGELDQSESFSGSSVLDVYKIRVCELEQDICFLKQSITTMYDIFKYIDDCSLDLDMDSIPDLVYFLERVGEHLKTTEKIKSKIDDADAELKNILNMDDDLDSDQKNLEQQIFDVVEKCDSCKGVVSDIKGLVEKSKSYKRRQEFDPPIMKRIKTAWEEKSSMPVFPEFRKQGEPEKSTTVHSYCGLPTISGEEGDVVVYTGQNFDMEQYLRETGLKRRRPMKYRCGACNKEFSKLKYVKSHYQHQHVIQKKLYCNDCGLSFSYKSNLTRHQRLIHMGDRKEKCHICDASFGTRSQLDSHLRKCHNAPKLNCTDCGQTFIQEQSLRNHTEVCPANSNHVRVMCGICLKSFSAKRYLQNHIRAKHSDRKSTPHVCDICFKSFSGQFALKRHRVKKHRDQVKNLAIKEDIEDTLDSSIKTELDKSTDVSVGLEDTENDDGDESMEEGEENDDMEMYGSATVLVPRNGETLSEKEEGDCESPKKSIVMKVKLKGSKNRTSHDSDKKQAHTVDNESLDTKCEQSMDYDDKVKAFTNVKTKFEESFKHVKQEPHETSNYTKEYTADDHLSKSCAIDTSGIKRESADGYLGQNEKSDKNTRIEAFEKTNAAVFSGLLGNPLGVHHNSSSYSRPDDVLPDVFKRAIESSYVGTGFPGYNHAPMGLHPRSVNSLGNMGGVRPNPMMRSLGNYGTGMISPADALAALSHLNSAAGQPTQILKSPSDHYHKANQGANRHSEVRDEDT